MESDRGQKITHTCMHRQSKKENKEERESENMPRKSQKEGRWIKRKSDTHTHTHHILASHQAKRRWRN